MKCATRDAAAAAVVIHEQDKLIKREKAKKDKTKSCWVHQWTKDRSRYGWFEKLMGYLDMDDTKRYNNFVRMDHDMFDEMVDRLTPRILKQDNSMRRALEPGLNLAITLRFLATGDSNTICSLVPEVCQAIYDGYHQELIKCPASPEGWKQVTQGFANFHIFHCVGGVDGKHVKIQAPPSSGSLYYNYEGTFSIVLMTAVNAN